VKNLIKVLIALTVLLITSGCSSTLRVITDTVASRISSPALTNLGLGNHRLAITNGTDYFGRVIINGQKFDGVLHPGQSLYSNWSYQAITAEIPVTVFFFGDTLGESMVGAADHIFRVSEGQPNSSESWTPENQDITTPDGHGRKLKTPPSSATFNAVGSTEIEFKRTNYGGTAIIQVANLTPNVIIIRVDGKNTDIIGPAGYAFIQKTAVGTFPDRITLQYVFVNRGISRSRTIYIPTNGVRADCVILTARSIL